LGYYTSHLNNSQISPQTQSPTKKVDKISITMYKEKELKEGEEGIGMITLGYVRSAPN